MSTSASLYYRHRFAIEIISHCVWLYFRFALNFRDVEEMMLIRGVSLTHETVRDWCLKFGQTYANSLRRRPPRAGDCWHLDEVFLKINGRDHYLWRAVDPRNRLMADSSVPTLSSSVVIRNCHERETKRNRSTRSRSDD